MASCSSRSRPRVTCAASPTTSSTSSRREIRDFLVRTVRDRTGGHLGPNLGVVELTLAIHRVFDSPARPGRLRHRPPGLRAQAASPAAPRTSTRCARRAASAATRARPSPTTTSSRTPTPPPRCQLRRRAGQGLRDPRRGPARRRGDRRRRAHRRHGLGGAQQHRDRQATAGWSSSSTTTAAPTRRPSAASPPRSPRCAPTRATSTSSTWSSGASTPSPASAPRRTTPCTR